MEGEAPTAVSAGRSAVKQTRACRRQLRPTVLSGGGRRTLEQMQPGPVFLRPALPRGVWWLSARCGFGSGAGGGGRRGLVSVLPPTKPRPRRLPRVGVPCPGAAGKPVRVQTLLAHRSGRGDGETGRGRSPTPLLPSPSAQRASVRHGGPCCPPAAPACERPGHGRSSSRGSTGRGDARRLSAHAASAWGPARSGHA